MANVVKTVQIVVDAKDHASGVIKGIGGALQTAIGTFAGGAALKLATAGFDKLTSVIGDGIADARTAAKVFAQTEQVIKSTGGAAGFTADQISAMAGSLSAAAGKSLFGDDDIQAGQNILLTFTDIKEVLPDTTRLMVDLSQAMGQDMKSSALQLGKALNNPTKGVTALTRVGVTFTKKQKDMIESLQSTGHMAEAQRIILAELTREFGGSAEAAARADGGWAQFTDAMGEAGETIGRSLLPALGKVGALLSSPAVLGAITAVAEALGTGLGKAVDWLVTVGLPALGQLASWVGTIGSLIAAGDIAGAFGTLFAGLSGVAGQIGTIVAAWGQALIDWIAPRIPDMLTALGGLLARMGAWIITQIPVIAAQLGAWGLQLLGWIIPRIPGMIEAMKTFAIAVGKAIADRVPDIVAKTKEWADALVAWIKEKAIPALKPAFDQLIDELKTQASRAAAALSEKGNQAGIALTEGLKLGWAQAPVELDGLMTRMGQKLIDATPGLQAQMKALGLNMIVALTASLKDETDKGIARWGGDLVTMLAQLGPTLIVAAFDLGNQIGFALAGGLKDFIIQHKVAFATLGIAIINFVAEGIDTVRYLVTQAFVRLGPAMLDGIKKGLSTTAADFAIWLGDWIIAVARHLLFHTGIGGITPGSIGTPGGNAVIGQAIGGASLRDGVSATLPSGFASGRTPSVTPRALRSDRPSLTVDLRGASFGAGLTEGQVKGWIAPVLDDALSRWEHGLMRETTDLGTRGALR